MADMSIDSNTKATGSYSFQQDGVDYSASYKVTKDGKFFWEAHGGDGVNSKAGNEARAKLQSFLNGKRHEYNATASELTASADAKMKAKAKVGEAAESKKKKGLVDDEVKIRAGVVKLAKDEVDLRQKASVKAAEELNANPKSSKLKAAFETALAKETKAKAELSVAKKSLSAALEKQHKADETFMAKLGASKSKQGPAGLPKNPG